MRPECVALSHKNIRFHLRQLPPTLPNQALSARGILFVVLCSLFRLFTSIVWYYLKAGKVASWLHVRVKPNTKRSVPINVAFFTLLVFCKLIRKYSSPFVTFLFHCSFVLTGGSTALANSAFNSLGHLPSYHSMFALCWRSASSLQ